MRTREPVLVGLGMLNAVAVSALVAATALGWLDLTGEQIAAVSAFVLALSGAVGAMVRASVVPTARYESDVVDALFTPVPGVRNDNLEGL